MHRAYMWTHRTPSSNPTKAVVFRFSETSSGESVRESLPLATEHGWKRTLVIDGFGGYHGTMIEDVISAQCTAHARREFHELHVNHGSEVGREALRFQQVLFCIERKVEDQTAADRRRT